MPKERIKQGNLIVIEAAGAVEARSIQSQEPVGITARNVHVYEVGEVLKEGDVVEEHPSFDIHWSKIGEGGTAQLSVTISRDLIQEMLADPYQPDEEHLRFFSDDLSRRDLNRLIALGRHVRDSAHGKDE